MVSRKSAFQNFVDFLTDLSLGDGLLEGQSDQDSKQQNPPKVDGLLDLLCVFDVFC